MLIIDTPRQPWVDSPYSLHTWWDMDRFAAASFCQIASEIAKFSRSLESYPRDAEIGLLAVMPQRGEDLALLETACRKIDLKISAGLIADLRIESHFPGTVGELLDRLKAIEDLIRREMRVELFFHVPSQQAEFYSQAELFGPDVVRAFPSITFDMVEAGNCYAMGRGTACVFHLMRVMEIGVQRLGTKLGVALAGEKNWQNILNEVNKAIKALPPKDSDNVEMGAAAANLYAVKLAWRNEVMHPNDKYTLEEAKDLLLLVRVFMCQLAAVV